MLQKSTPSHNLNTVYKARNHNIDTVPRSHYFLYCYIIYKRSKTFKNYKKTDRCSKSYRGFVRSLVENCDRKSNAPELSPPHNKSQERVQQPCREGGNSDDESSTGEK